MNKNTAVLLGVAATTLAVHHLTKNSNIDRIMVFVVTGVVANLAIGAAYDQLTK